MVSHPVTLPPVLPCVPEVKRVLGRGWIVNYCSKCRLSGLIIARKLFPRCQSVDKGISNAFIIVDGISGESEFCSRESLPFCWSLNLTSHRFSAAPFLAFFSPPSLLFKAVSLFACTLRPRGKFASLLHRKRRRGDITLLRSLRSALRPGGAVCIALWARREGRAAVDIHSVTPKGWGPLRRLRGDSRHSRPGQCPQQAGAHAGGRMNER